MMALWAKQSIPDQPRPRRHPIRNFYFDGTNSDLDRDIGIFLELARSYQRHNPGAGKCPRSRKAATP